MQIVLEYGRSSKQNKELEEHFLDQRWSLTFTEKGISFLKMFVKFLSSEAIIKLFFPDGQTKNVSANTQNLTVDSKNIFFCVIKLVARMYQTS